MAEYVKNLTYLTILYVKNLIKYHISTGTSVFRPMSVTS